MDGKYAFELKIPWADGTRIIFLSGEELVGRLTALVPPPRMHLVHFYGILAPNAKLRSRVVPQAEKEEEEESLTSNAVCWEEEQKGQTVRRRWVPWAKLLLKVFGVDVFQCPRCDGRMQRIAFITQPRIINAILECVGQKEQPP
jgi:Putative transposase